jgi:hypothetical protein
MDSDTVKVAAGSAVKIVIDAPQIELVDGASHPVAFGDEVLQYLTQLVQMFNVHMHPGEMAAGIFPVAPMPPVPPLQPPTPSLFSTKVNSG